MTKPSYTWDEAADQITRNLSPVYLPADAQGLTLTYAYRATATVPQGPPGTAGQWIGGLNVTMQGFTQFNQTQIAVMERSLDLIEEVANIKLNRVGTGLSGPAAYTDNAELLFGNFTTWPAVPDAHGSGNLVFHIDAAGNYTRAAKAWFRGTEDRMIDANYTNSASYLFLHETLHTLGLSHPGNYSVRDEEAATFESDAIFAQDNRQFTVMSYFGPQNSGGHWGSERPYTPMMYDIAALQKVYGANMTTRTGDTVYGFNSNTGYENFTFTGETSRKVFTIWDAGGQDTLDLSGFKTSATINLEAESFSSGGVRSGGGQMINNIAIARGVVIENAIGGSADDVITGNGARNKLRGNEGNDTLGGGADTDTAIFSGRRLDYTITNVTATTGTSTVVDTVVGRDGTDSLSGIERLRFSDVTLAFDEAAAQVYRLYQAAFARTPDVGGLSYWVDTMDKGLALRDIVYGFINSTEFASAYGANPTNAQLVDKLYQNILGRPPEKAGIDYWAGVLDGGGSRLDVFASISESGENRDKIAPTIGQGVILDNALLI